MATTTGISGSKAGVVKRRCGCTRCGVHSVHAVGKATLGGRCSNCGSYELVPLNRSWSAAVRTA